MWDFVYRDTSWIDASFNLSGEYQMLFSLLSEQALLEDKVKRLQRELYQPPLPIPVAVASPEMGFFSWLPFGGETLFESAYCLDVTAETVEEWQRWWHLYQFGVERLRERVRSIEPKDAQLLTWETFGP